jgi:D-3-phosphoglycerate dehydrogenase
MQRSMERFADRLAALGIGWDCPEIPGQQFSAGQLAPIVGEYDAIIAGDDQITETVLRSGLPRMRVVAKWGVGVDSIDLVAARQLGIKVTNTPGMFDEEVADVAFGYAVSLLRGLHQIDRAVRRGEWLKIEGRSLRGATLGIVGVGGTGRALAVRARATGMAVLGVETSPRAAELAVAVGARIGTFEEVLAGADVLSLHCPLTPETTGLLSADALALMPLGSFVINTSRGRVVDEVALIDALRSGHIVGAALDVFEDEPLPVDSPLREFDNVILGSHNASNSREAVERTSECALDNALAGLGLT